MASIARSFIPLPIGLPRSEKPSLISLQIAMMQRKVLEVQNKLESLDSQSQGKILSDAIDLLAHYEYVVSELMKPYKERDPNIRYFNENSFRIYVEENPTKDELASCNELLIQIKACGLDLSQAQDLISYRGAAYEIEEEVVRIEAIADKILPSISEFFGTIKNQKRIPDRTWIMWSSEIKRLEELINIVNSMVNDHELQIINFFTIEGKLRFFNASGAANGKVLAIISSLRNLIFSRTGCNVSVVFKRIRTDIIRRLDVIALFSKEAEYAAYSKFSVS